MRKLMSKKGFTLVELMIVVVILGILVAVAVPIFSAVTKNARRKTCQANMRVIKGNMETYQTTGSADGEGNEVAFASGDTDLVSTTPANFMKLFDGGKLPTCPTEGAAYIVKVTNTSGTITYTVQCNGTEKDYHNGVSA